jgi:NAD(P) transhydrogenase subunit alpha
MTSVFELAFLVAEPRAELCLVAQHAAGTGGRLDSLLTALTIFVLAMWVGFEVITKVPATLHTPLTSGSNAVSGITVVGALVAVAAVAGTAVSVLGFLATVLATINVVGGFLVTHRMLSMFRRKE